MAVCAGVRLAQHIAISREAKTRVSRRTEEGRIVLPDMQIEEVGVRVCNVARKTRRVGETFRYFTIILSPTVIAVAAKSSRKKDRSDQGEMKGQGHVAFSTSAIRNIVQKHIDEAKIRKLWKIVSYATHYIIYNALIPHKHYTYVKLK